MDGPHLAPDALLILDCVRGRGCCHAQRIPVTPWELARLARARALSPPAAREQFTDDAGTRLRAVADGACTLLGPDGCTVHPARPLACRLFPLGRRQRDGAAAYHMPGGAHRCGGPCPEALAQAPRRLDGWLAEQQVGPGEAAHDAYGRLVAGLVAQAAALDAAAATAALAAGARLGPTGRRSALPAPWFELATAPELNADPADPLAFVQAHAEALLGAVAAGFAGDAPTAAGVLALVACHLAEPLGIPPEALAAHAAGAGTS
jgi:Fe-S-cluster containining protein